jgi:DNA polymerase V
MEQKQHMYLAIDLKSFYASVECMERGLDPITTNLVVADASRTEKTICLAVSPSLKAYGIPGRARLFEVVERVREVNRERQRQAPGGAFSGASYDAVELQRNPSLELSYITAPPRMAFYVEYSTRIYDIYLKYVAPEDMHVYSIDEIFCDVTEYLKTYDLTPRELAMKMIRDVYQLTGITATAGIGTNLYLAKVAMDIVAKHVEPDENGVRIAELDERTYRKLLWGHQPITDFWRVGSGYKKKLAEHGMFTMGDVARCSIGKSNEYHNEDLLYKLFGVNAELLIDHAWGWEPCTIADIKAYKPQNNSICSGQVLECPYPADKARLIVQEMADLLVLDLVDKKLVTNQLVLTVGYDVENLKKGKNEAAYQGAVTIDRYGRRIPRHAHGTANLKCFSSSTRQITEAVLKLYDQIIDPSLMVRRLSLTANRIVEEESVKEKETYEQLDLFTDYEALKKERQKEEQELEREKKLQNAMLDIKKKFGKNAILKGMNLKEGATTIKRNSQIGGHKA